MSVSVIIPTYNRCSQVFRAIDCALAQTLPVDEIIVVDDGSTDGTADSVERHYGSQVRVLRQANSGVSAARNLGIREASGEWIALLDSDDWWDPKKLRLQFAAIECLGGVPGVCFTDNVYGGNPAMTYSRFAEVGFRHPPPLGLLGDTSWRIVTEREPFFTSSFLIRRDLLVETGGFDEALTIREDTDLAFRLSLKTQFCFVREALTEIDRTPSRAIGLCNVYGTRSDVIYDCSERIYAKWLSLPEVIGSPYEAPLRELLRDARYASAESKLRQLRLKAALRSLSTLKATGEGAGEILATFAERKIRKTKRNWAKRMAEFRHKPENIRLGAG